MGLEERPTGETVKLPLERGELERGELEREEVSGQVPT